jgi:hypothetical protein
MVEFGPFELVLDRCEPQRPLGIKRNNGCIFLRRFRVKLGYIMKKL